MTAISSRHRPQPRSLPSISSTSRTKLAHQQIPLSKRLLFPTHITDELPPLFASSSAPPELTAEIYDFIALALRAFVNPWWTKITRYDKEFLPQITHILSIVVRALEARVLTTDLSPLVFRDIPMILTQHYCDYRNASSKLTTSYASSGAVSLPQLFHQLQPHMAISAEGKIEEEYFRQIIDHILKSCLPAEDYEPDAERFIIREIILKVVMNDVVPKITQPWFIQKTILDLLDPLEDQLQPLKHPDRPTSAQSSTSSFSFHTLLVILLSAIQALSGVCLALIHTYKQAISTIKLVNQSPPKLHSHILSTSSAPAQSSSSSPISAHRLTAPVETPQPASSPLHPLVSPSPSPSASSSASSRPQSGLFPHAPSPTHPTPSTFVTDREGYDYARHPIAMLSEIFTTHDRFASNTIMTTLGMISTAMTPFLDRLLPHLLTTYLSHTFLINTIRTAKRTLFPNGYPAPPPLDPSPEEQAMIRERLVAWRGKSVFTHLTPLILGPDPSATLGAALDPLTSAPCNVHLVVMVLDRVLVELFPELG